MWLSLVHFMSFRKTCHKNVPPTSWQVILSRASVAEKKKENKNFLECKVILEIGYNTCFAVLGSTRKYL